MFQAPTNLWSAFDEAVERHPDRVALRFPESEISFAALRSAAEGIAARLHDARLARGDVVVLQIAKRPETYACWLACLRQGLVFCFVDPNNPEQRTESILRRLAPRLLVTEGDTVNPSGLTWRLPAAVAPDWLEPGAKAPPPAATHGLDPAYVMFTSGSTGEPKGAVIPQQGVLSLMRWAAGRYRPQDGLVCSNVNPLHFDNSVFDLYCGLMNGGTLVPVDTARIVNPAHWVRQLREAQTELIFAVPTWFRTLQSLRLLTPDRLPDARTFIFGGEGFPIAELEDFRSRFDGKATLWNVYGPTETSCICSSHRVDASAIEAARDGLVSLGRMHEGFVHGILNEDGEPAAPNAAGELWIGGSNVGLGYFNNPEETARRFRQDPQQENYRSIWYRTGDLVREDADGLLWFLGRVDNQVKLRGHRVELEEVDLALERLPGVEKAIAAVVAGPDGPELRAAFTAKRKVPIDEVLNHCQEFLPVYMRPAIVRQFEMLPQNANGKVDRKATAGLLNES